MNDSYKIGHSRCPECAKNGRDNHGDNLVEYSDGHSHCFACGYRHYNHLKSRFTQREELVSSQDSRKGHKEYTYSNDIPRIYRRWLNRYQITPELIERYGIKYNETTHGLCFKLPGEGEVERYLYEAEDKEDRKDNFRRVRKQKKWILVRKRVGSPSGNTWGPPGSGRIVVLVEDAVSGIKLAEFSGLQGKVETSRRHICSYPLLGTNINGNDLYSLCRAFSGVGVWLDRDKRNHALKVASRASQWNSNVRVICSEKDPKEYSSEEIRNFLRELVSNK